MNQNFRATPLELYYVTIFIKILGLRPSLIKYIILHFYLLIKPYIKPRRGFI